MWTPMAVWRNPGAPRGQRCRSWVLPCRENSATNESGCIGTCTAENILAGIVVHRSSRGPKGITFSPGSKTHWIQKALDPKGITISPVQPVTKPFHNKRLQQVTIFSYKFKFRFRLLSYNFDPTVYLQRPYTVL